MIVGKIVKIRFKRYFAEQKLWVFIGRVREFTENWVVVEGKGIVVFKGRADPADVDGAIRTLVVPRDHIAHIRVLPDTFDVGNIRVRSDKFRLYVEVDGGPDSSISE